MPSASSIPLLELQDRGNGSQSHYRQANAISRSAQNLNLFQKRLIVLGLSLIDHASSTPTLTVDVPMYLFERFGVENPYHRARQAATALLDTRIIINRDGGGFEAYSWVSKVSYVPVGDSANDRDYSFIRLDFHEELRPFITNLRAHYAQLPIADVVSLPSITAVRLYELLATMAMSGKRPCFDLELMELKQALNMVEQGSRPGTWRNEKQKQWRDFRKTLIRTIDTLHEYTSMRVAFEGMRVGRRIGRIRFDVVLDARQKVLPPIGDSIAELKERLNGVGFQGSVEQLLERHSFEAVESAIGITQQRMREGNVRNPGGFLRSLLLDGSAAAVAQSAGGRPDADGGVPDDEATREGTSDDADLYGAWRAYRTIVARNLVASEKLPREELLTMVRSDYGQHPIFRTHVQELEASEDLEAAPQVQASLFARFEEELPDEVLDFDAFKIRPIYEASYEPSK